MILALLVVTVVGVLLAVVVDFAGAGLSIAPKARDARNESNYVQGLVDGAINNIRGSSTFGHPAPAPACPAFPSAAGIAGPGGQSYSVTCEARTPPLGAAADQPRFAIHALGTGTEGIRQVGGNHQLSIKGGIYSKGVVESVAGVGNEKNRIFVNGSVDAEGACIGNIDTSDETGIHCPTPASGTSFGDDPAYLAAITSTGPDATDTNDLFDIIGADTTARKDLGADPIPTCSGNGPVTFTEGYYSEHPGTLVKERTSCTGSLYHFTPGRYYFDYPGVWDLGAPGKTTVVGGTLSGSSVLGQTCDPTSPGVQFIFGGSSQLTVTGQGGIEICAPTASQGFPGTPQRISMYGLSALNGNKNKTATASAPTPTPSLTATAEPKSTGNPKFSPTADATSIDGNSASATVTKNQSVATLSYSGFAHVPKGARVTGVKVRVAHGLPPVNVKSSLLIKTDTEPSPNVNKAVAVPATCLATCLVDIYPSGAATAFRTPAWRDVNTLQLDYIAEIDNNSVPTGVSTVDGLELVVTYLPPTLQPHACVSPCSALFTSTVNLNVFLHGTVYAPSAKLAVSVQNDSGTVFERGIVVRTVDIIVSASSTQTAEPFQLPAGTPTGRRVLLRGYVEGVEKVRACVEFDDAAAVGDRVRIRRWALLREAPSTVSMSFCP